jgi:gliding motility-associated-like protein
MKLKRKFAPLFALFLLVILSIQLNVAYAQNPCPPLFANGSVTALDVASCLANNGIVTVNNSLMGGTGPYTYTFNGTTTTGTVFNGLSAGSYPLTVVDANGCKDSIIMVIKNTAGITAVGVSPTTPITCNTSTGLINIGSITSVNPGNFTIQLVQTGQTINWPATTQITGLPQGVYTLIVTDALGCKFTVNGIRIIHRIDPGGSCNAGNDVTIFEGESAFINGTGDGTVSWDPPNFLSDTKSVNPTATPPPGIHTYTINVFNPSSCTICTDDVVITVIPELNIPNTFTPNGDGDNDVWVIGGLNRFDDCEIWIYTRWGQRVFHQNGYETGEEWNGTNRGLSLSPATYYYIIDIKKKDADGKVKKYAGAITIIK